MSARILDGKRIAQELLGRIGRRVAARKALGLPPPGLAVILVGTDAGSMVYVRKKREACDQVGFRSFAHDLPADTTQQALFALIDRLNADPEVHGILVQSPLPPHIDEDAMVDRIDPAKDVDGFQAINVGRLALRRFGLRLDVGELFRERFGTCFRGLDGCGAGTETRFELRDLFLRACGLRRQLRLVDDELVEARL